MRQRYEYAGQIHEVRLERQGDSYRAVIDGQEFTFELLDTQPGQITLRSGGRPITIYWAEANGARWISYRGCTYKLEQPARPAFGHTGETGGSALLRAPMPAQVREIMVSPGTQVTQGQTLLLLEAMKMEIRIQSPRPASVTRVNVSPGEQVERDQVLIELDG